MLGWLKNLLTTLVAYKALFGQMRSIFQITACLIGKTTITGQLENALVARERNHQVIFPINYWSAILGNRVLAVHFLPWESYRIPLPSVIT